MQKIWQKIKAWLFPDKTVPRKPASIKSTANSEDYGHWYFKRDILDNLERYMTIARRIKKTDPEGYAIYRHVGAVIPTEKCMLPENDLPARWRVDNIRPSFCAVAALQEDNPGDMLGIKFAYIRKMTQPPFDVEPSNGTVYEVVAFYNRHDDESHYGRFTARFYASVDDQCNIKPLRQVIHSSQVIRHKNGDVSRIKHKSWGFPLFLTDDGVGESGPTTPEQRASFIFCMIASFSEQCLSACRVYATRNNITACFGVDVTRVPYFFKDRDDVVVNGQKKKIFHIVRTFPRTNKDGSITYVPSHFRGLRQFNWNGYEIHISMPGKHGIDVLDADFGAVSCDDGDEHLFPDSIHANAMMRRIGAYQRELRQ